MTSYKFEIKEISHKGLIYWEAEDLANNERFRVNEGGKFRPGEYPEIAEYLKKSSGTNYDINYRAQPPFNDTFDQQNQKWSFHRNGDTVEVQDMPRTMLRITQN